MSGERGEEVEVNGQRRLLCNTCLAAQPDHMRSENVLHVDADDCAGDARHGDIHANGDRSVIVVIGIGIHEPAPGERESSNAERSR